MNIITKITLYTILAIVASVSTLVYIDYAFAEEINQEYFDGVNYPIEYNIENGTLVDYKYDEMGEGLIFTINGTDGKFTITFPKSMPFDWTPDAFNHDMAIIIDKQEAEKNSTTTTCDYIMSTEFSGFTQIEIYNFRIPEGPRYIYHQIDEECLENEKYNTDIQKKLQQKSCYTENSVRSINARDEVVCVFSDSFNKLYHWGYLKAMVGN